LQELLSIPGIACIQETGRVLQWEKLGCHCLSEELREITYPRIGWIFVFGVEQQTRRLSLSTKWASWLGFGCNNFHKFHSSTLASQTPICLVSFVHVQELLQGASQGKYYLQTPQHARKKINSW